MSLTYGVPYDSVRAWLFGTLKKGMVLGTAGRSYVVEDRGGGDRFLPCLQGHGGLRS